MIHYTLLPEKEIRILKKEYRTRLLIIFLFFICFAVLVGIASLFPAYIFSSIQEKEALIGLDNIKKERQGTGVDSILKELTATNDLVKKINTTQNPYIASDMIGRVISHRTPGIQLTSFQFSSVTDGGKNATTSTTQIVIQGQAANRDTLVDFKSNLEANPLFSKIELPVSDLTKSKDIPFSIRLSIISTK